MKKKIKDDPRYVKYSSSDRVSIDMIHILVAILYKTIKSDFSIWFP